MAGYAAVTPSWPDDPETVAEARAHPEVFARKTIGQVADHTAEVIGGLGKKPAVIGHSTGGLLAHIIADRGLSAATVAIDPGPFRGVLSLPIPALRAASPVLRNPFNRGRAITLTLDQFKYGWANALDDEEAERLYETYHVATPGVALMQMANANLNPRTEARLNPKNPDRGPHLIIEGENDHTVRGRSRTQRSSASDRTRRSPSSKRSPTAVTRSPSTAVGARWPNERWRSSSASSEVRPLSRDTRQVMSRPPEGVRHRIAVRTNPRRSPEEHIAIRAPRLFPAARRTIGHMSARNLAG